MHNDISEIAALVSRVDTLERQSRRLKHICIALVVTFSGVAAAQTMMPKPITASRVTLVDDENRTRAQLETSIPGSGRAGVNPTLSFIDQDGRVRLRLGLGLRGATLEVVDENGKTHEFLGAPTVRPATQ
jgi:hypothetical protein